MHDKRVENARVLIVEDDAALREAIADTLELAGAKTFSVPGGEPALEMLRSECVDIVVSDVNMQGMDGHRLLREIRATHPQLPVVLITAFGSISRCVEAMRDGAVDYLVKPFQPEILIDTVVRWGSMQHLSDDEPVAVEQRSIELFRLARQVAAADSTVLLCGESGSGKEVVARFIHRHSPRRAASFVAINCAAIPENMLEALLFGHEKGAFTGAYSAMPGKFEQAEGGTLLLDEVSEMAPSLQAKLLRVLQEREVERLGGRKCIAIDVRVIATSNRDLRTEVAEGRFREDLYYRLSVFPLRCLALRERPGDIIPLANTLLRQHVLRMHHVPAHLDAGARAALLAHAWPGNVRELDNAVQRALILQPGASISAAHLLLENHRQMPAPAQAVVVSAIDEEGHPPAAADGMGGKLGGDLRAREFQIIVNTLKDTRGSKSSAAQQLGISARTLRYKLARFREAGFDVETALRSA